MPGQGVSPPYNGLGGGLNYPQRIPAPMISTGIIFQRLPSCYQGVGIQRSYSLYCAMHAEVRHNFVIFISETSVEFVIFFLFLQPQLLQIHLSPENLNTVIHFSLAFHRQISTTLQSIQNSLERVIINIQVKEKTN